MAGSDSFYLYVSVFVCFHNPSCNHIQNPVAMLQYRVQVVIPLKHEVLWFVVVVLLGTAQYSTVQYKYSTVQYSTVQKVQYSTCVSVRYSNSSYSTCHAAT